MKKTKVIIPALGILLLSTAASVTGTVAWFSMNNTVTATNMKVTVQSDAAFLLIAANDPDADPLSASDVQELKKTKVDAFDTTDQLFPVAHDAIAKTDDAEAKGTGENAKLTKWYYRYSNDPESANGNSELPGDPLSAKTYIASFDGYVLKNTFSITVAEGSNTVSNLQVGSVSIDATDKQAVNVLITTGGTNGAAQEFSGDGSTKSPTGDVVLAPSVTSTSVIVVSVYIYWDGNNEEVYTNGIGNLKDTSVEITFTGEVA